MRHLRLFQYIDTIAREGSVRRAAEKLYVTASALDRRLQDVEEEIGTQLFERHARGMRLTAAGELYINYARRHIAESERLKSEINRLRGTQQGRVTITVSPALVTSFIPNIVREYRVTHPGISISVKVAQHEAAIQDLLNYDADLAVIIAPPEHPDVLDLAVASQPILAAIDNSHPLSHEQVLRLSDCVNYPLALPSPGLTTRRLLDAALRKLQATIRISVETNSYEVLYSILRGTEQIGFVLSAARLIGNDNDTIVYRPIKSRDIHPIPIICAQLRHRVLSVAAAQFSQIVIREIENMHILD